MKKFNRKILIIVFLCFAGSMLLFTNLFLGSEVNLRLKSYIGDSDSQFILAKDWLNHGGALPKDIDKAYYWLVKSSNNGNIQAGFELSIFYARSDHKFHSMEKSMYWWNKTSALDKMKEFTVQEQKVLNLLEKAKGN